MKKYNNVYRKLVRYKVFNYRKVKKKKSPQIKMPIHQSNSEDFPIFSHMSPCSGVKCLTLFRQRGSSSHLFSLARVCFCPDYIKFEHHQDMTTWLNNENPM